MEKKENLLNFSHFNLLSCEMSDKQFLQISKFITSKIGIKLPAEKKIMLQSRLQKRLRSLKFSSFDQYIQYLFNNSIGNEEIKELFDVITTNKTDFFRENRHFDFINQQYLSKGLHETAAKRELKIWSAGCSTGEEAITIAITFEEFIKKNKYFQYKIFASDIAESVLKLAKKGEYSTDKTKDIPTNLLRTYFVKNAEQDSKTYFVKEEIKRKIQYEKLNLMKPLYTTPDLYDIIFCRNVLIYFDKNTQFEVLNKLINRLQKGGYLFIGHSESLMGLDLPVEMIVPTIFRKL